MRASCSRELNRTFDFLHLQQHVSIDLHQLQLRSAERCVDVATTAAPTLRRRIRRNATRSQCVTRRVSATRNPMGENDGRKKAPREAGLVCAAEGR